VWNFIFNPALFCTAEQLEHLFFRRRLEYVSFRELVCLGITGAADRLGGSFEIVSCALEFDAAPEQKPICSRVAERHAYAAGINNSKITNHAIELRVGMAANYNRGIYVRECG
jgi:hypothetical protein